MPKLVRSIVSVVVRRFHSRAVLQLENLALRHQLHVLRRQRPGRPRLLTMEPPTCRRVGAGDAPLCLRRRDIPSALCTPITLRLNFGLIVG
jgi:hypothetical protein